VSTHRNKRARWCGRALASEMTLGAELPGTCEGMLPGRRTTTLDRVLVVTCTTRGSNILRHSRTACSESGREDDDKGCLDADEALGGEEHGNGGDDFFLFSFI